MELLERFAPAHGLVDTALAELRARHADRERERLRREKQAQRQQQIAALTSQAGALVRNRAALDSAAALLVLVVLVASWSSIFPPKPIEPATVDPGAAESGAVTPGGQPAGADRGDGPATVPPAEGDVPSETPKVDAGATETTPKTPVAGLPAVPPGTTPAPTNSRTPGQPTPNGGTQAQTPSGGQQLAGQDRDGAAVAAVPPGGVAAPTPEAVPDAGARTEPTPETPRDTAKVTAPPADSDLKDVAKAEIRRWIDEYTVAYQRKDEAHVHSMNPLSTFKAAQYKQATVTFSNVDIQPRDDGQSAVLLADVQYQFGFSRGDPQTTSTRIAWRMRKTPAGWIVEK